MKRNLLCLSLPFAMIFVLLNSLCASAQSLTFFKCSPNYSEPSTGVYYSNIKVRVEGDQTGNAYYAIYSTQPSTSPSASDLYQWGEGAAAPPGVVVGHGKIAVSAVAQEFSETVYNLTPNKDYFAYAMLRNSTNVNGAVSSVRKIHLMRGVKGDFYYFTEYLPADYSTTSKKYPLLLFLHGTGESGVSSNYTIATLADIVISGPPKHITEMTTIPELRERFIVISPQSPTNADNGGWNTNEIHNLITDLKTQYPRIDPSRIYVTGLSMGGFGTWKYALAHPDVPAAILPISGGGSKTNACLLADMPIWAWHDVPDKEGRAPSSGTTDYYDAITACPGYTGQMQMTLKTQLDESCNKVANHSVWNVAYGPTHSTPYLDDPCGDGSGGLDIEEKHTEMPPGTTVYKWLLWQTRGFRANAGNDVELTAPVASYNLVGTTTSPATSYQWSKVSGANVTISNATSSTATVTGMSVGTYVFQLLVTNSNGGMDIDLVKVTVNSDGGGGPGKTVKIDFTTSVPSSTNAEWNHFVAAGTAPASLNTLKYTDGATSGYSIALTAPFNAATSNGMSTGIYPAYVMQSSWYTSGTSTASLTISGLDNGKKYTLKLFGSRTDAETVNRNTEYAVGTTIKVVNASNNTSVTADHEELTPTNGSLTFTVRAQANASGYGYLNAMEIVEITPVISTTGTLKVDVCSGVPASPLPDWNHFAGSGAAGLSMANLKYDNGTVTNYSVTVNAGFSSTTSNGMTGGDYPNTVAATSWYTSGLSTVASISLNNLNNAHKYTLIFFGSRTDAGETVNRNTEYTVGSTTVTLNASNNVNDKVFISDITPTNGKITFTVKAAAGGQNYGYLNAFEVIETDGTVASMATLSDEMASKQTDESNTYVYPTRITNQINIVFDQQVNGRVSVSVMDINGKAYLMRDNIEVSNAEPLTIDLSGAHIPKGIVVIKVISSDGSTKTLKAIKE
jgi:hypothetical protein